MLSQSLRNPVDQLKTPLNPAGFRLTLAPNVSRPIIPSRQATALIFGLLEGTRWVGCVQAPRCWITRTAPHCWIIRRSARGDPIGCARLLAHHWLREKNVVIGPKRKPSSGPLNCVVFFASFALFVANVLALYFCIFFASFALFFASFFLFYTNVKWRNL